MDITGPVAQVSDPVDPNVSPTPEAELLPPGYPEQWAADVVLRDGGTCHLRPIIPSDRDALQAFHIAQSDRTRYLRFFAPLPRLSERDLNRFTQVDYRDRVALIAIIHGRIVGVGRYDVIDPGEAEVAFNIADSQQGRGLGSVLLEHLAAAALDRGIDKFVAEVLPENRKMVQVFADAGYEVRHHFEDGVISLEFGIQPTTKSLAVIASRERRAEAASLNTIMSACSIAVIGASDHEDSLGRVFLQNILDGGFAGSVYVVHPKMGEVCGVPAVSRIGDIDPTPEVAVLAIPPSELLRVAAQCAAAGVRGIIILTEVTGPRTQSTIRALVTTARSGGMRILGPGSLGVVNTDPEVNLNASLLPRAIEPGGLALFSQSSGLGLVLLAEASLRGLGIASVVSAGQRADISGNDLLQYWAEDERVRVIALYTESSGNPRKFSRIARAVATSKPVAMVRSWTSATVSASGGRNSLVPRQAFNAVLNQAGVIRADDVHHLIRIVQLLDGQPLPTGDRVAVVTNSPVLSSLVGDNCLSWKLEPVLIEPISGTPTQQELGELLRQVMARDDVDSVVVVLVPTLRGLPQEVLDVVGAESAAGGKTTMACLVAHNVLFGRVRSLGTVPVFSTPEDAIKALASVTRYAQWRGRDHGKPVDPQGCHRDRAEALVDEVLRSAPPEGITLDPERTRELLACYGISLTPTEWVSSLEEALDAASRLGYPVVLKYSDKALRERRDVIGARLGIDDEEELIADLEDMMTIDDPAVAAGFIIQPMVPSGVAIDLRTVEDPMFGPILSFGLTGDTSDLLGDVAYRMPPLTDVDVSDMVRELKASPRLFGHGGAAPVDIVALEDLVARVSKLAEDIPEVSRLDMGPVLAAAQSVTPLWAQIQLAIPHIRVDTGLVRRL